MPTPPTSATLRQTPLKRKKTWVGWYKETVAMAVLVSRVLEQYLDIFLKDRQQLDTRLLSGEITLSSIR